ncbi:hypothetical protein ACQ4PT_042013 [Festuca glaucescens]
MAPANALSLLTTILLLLFTSTPPSAAAAALQHPPPHYPSPADYKIYIVLLKPRADGAHLTMDDDARRDWHMSFLPSAVIDNGKPRLVSSYGTLFQGFAAWLTEEELEALSRNPGFGRWLPDGDMYLDTTHTPDFLDLNTVSSYIWDSSGYGKGIIVGVMDTGVNSGHPSFDDTGVPSPPARWKGTCAATSGFRCNNKIIGARSFIDGSSGPGDESGHGTHVASTAAGNFVANASYFHGGQAAGKAAGTAPLAHLAIYKVCDLGRCPYRAVVDGFEAAARDGVDVISASLISSRKDLPAPPYYEDAVTIAAFRAVAKGIIVVSAAGNRGPDRSSVRNDAPWHFTVGAGTVDRRISGDLVLEDGDLVEGEALVQGVNVNNYFPLHCPGEGDRKCLGVSADSASSHIVICDLVAPSVVKNLYDRGAAQVVIVIPEKKGHTSSLLDYGASTVQVPAATGQKIREYCQYPDAAAQVSFRGTLVNVGGAPMVAAFSSRGPSPNNPFIIKPDILAPGLNILAAGMEQDMPFVFKSGTSMATPHVSGVAALLKNLHPEWSPAAIRSAIMTTASIYDNVGDIILDEQRQRASVFDLGAGHITPQAAVSPGLVYDMDASDYAAFICNAFARHGHDDIQDIIGGLGLNCSTLPAGVRDIDLNYPSLVVPTNTTVQRTLTNVMTGSAVGEIYHAYVDMRDSVQVNVSPNNLSFVIPGEKHSFQVSADYKGKNTQVEGVLYWQSPYHRVSSRIVVNI